ncbi:chain-length determining protein [Rhodosalinus halophilus]|uniref:Chain-length determining protein n=1 Tax=Rhodosalinus halophilus TaxID=2259333 RepID=A0A365U8Z5_9RHOB|nr:chain-length determining protein [Rhodosalinus halophilus]RBI85439.1 chain-length determining protein [Rhodosalinus halophilus]
MTGLAPVDQVLSIVRRRFWLMAAIVVAGCAASVWYALNQPRAYQAVAAMQIRGPVVEEAGRASRMTVADQLDLIERRVMARDNLAALVETYDLFSDLPNLTTLEKVRLMREAVELEEMANDAPPYTPEGRIPAGMIIRVRLGDPELAAVVANDLLGRVVAASRRGLIEQARTAETFFVEEEARVSAEIEALEAEIADFKQEHAEGLPENLTSLRTQLSGLREAELEVERQILALDTTGERQRLEVLQRQRAMLENQRDLLRDRIDEIEATLARAPRIEQEYRALTRELAQLQEQFEMVTRRRAEAEMTRILEDRQNAEIFEVLETAIPPEYPISRSRRAIATAGGVASLAAAAIVAALLEFLNPAIRTAAQLEKALQIRPVVTIPTVRTRWEVRRRWIFGTAGLVLIAVGLPILLRLASSHVPALRPLAERLPALPQS